MNETILEIRRAASMQLPPETPSGLSPDRDERLTRDFLLKNEWGKDWFCTRERNTRERWDVEGISADGTSTKLEVKSRPVAKSNYDTWIIDMYKVDWMLENFPYDINLFVNSCGGKYHVYDMRYIQSCFSKKGVMSYMENGTREPRDFYYVPKKNFLIELSSWELGEGSENYGIFKD